MKKMMILGLLFVGCMSIAQGQDELCNDLMRAAYKGDVDAMKIALRTGIDIDAQDEFGRTALIFAVDGKNVDAVQMLIEQGADLEIQSEHGATALTLAVAIDDVYIAYLLIEHGANVNIRMDYNITLLSMTMLLVSHEMEQLLLESGFIPSSDDLDGLMTIMITIMYDSCDSGDLNDEDIEIFQKVLESGIDINYQNKDGRTLLMAAAMHGVIELVQIYIDYGADLNVQDNDGQTALMLASLNDELEVVQLLLDNGANKND